MRLLIGTPVLYREWIIQQWMAHVLDALFMLEEPVEFGFLFLGGESDPTFPIIDALAKEAQVKARVLYVEEPRPFDRREWGQLRYVRMVVLRNLMLEQVRLSAPDLYLSVDSDILLHPLAIRNLIESSQRFDAVGGRCYMTPRHHSAPSNMLLKGRSTQRFDTEDVVPVDVIMAIKLMTPRAYAFDYEFDRQGEDLGICKAWKAANLLVGYDGRVGSKHVMEPKYLNEVDARIGW